MPYDTTVDDLLIRDMELGESLHPDRFIQDAADEIDSRVGILYELPLDFDALPTYVQKYLKHICVRLASGRLLLAIATPAERDSTHAYGNSLIKQAQSDLSAIPAGTFELRGATRVDDADASRAPTLIQGDSESAVTAFEQFAFGGVCPPVPWRPGTGS